MTTVFEVENAGCTSCAQRVRNALAELGRVDSVEIDEAADRAEVRLSATASSEAEVNRVLLAASVGSGHAYRVAPGSWRAA